MSEKEKDDDDLPPIDEWLHVKKAIKISDKGKEKYKCPFCEKEFSKIPILTKHVKTHDKNCIIKSKKLSQKKRKKKK
jgi:hypothetical protein